jgi:hypothetical protein
MENNRRFTEILLGLFFLFIGASAVGIESPLFILLAIAGVYLLFRQFNNSRRAQGRNTGYEQDYLNEDFDVEPARERIYRHALEAVKEAGLDPDQVRVLVTDIGMMAYKSDEDPVVYRTRDVPDDVDYVQPFVQLRLPTKAVGRIRFEIVDSDGQILFVREDNHQLDRGRNLVTPAARLPIHDAQAMHGNWELRVSADGVALATHVFNWEETTTRVVRRHLSEDGEISSELRATLAENRLEKLSLDDLLGYQDDENDSQQKSRR